MSRRRPTPSSCSATHLIDDAGQPTWLACSVSSGHDGPHQAYYRDRLHEWPNITN